MVSKLFTKDLIYSLASVALSGPQYFGSFQLVLQKTDNLNFLTDGKKYVWVKNKKTTKEYKWDIEELLNSLDPREIKSILQGKLYVKGLIK